MPNPTPQTLSDHQLTALFDILTHRALYAEITSFTSPAAISTYGAPFQPNTASRSPILQTLLARFVLTIPGLRDVDPDFWRIRVRALLSDLAAAELSESYDKGVLGIRKTLATAVSALIEYPARGVLGGLRRDVEALEEGREYDVGKAEEVSLAFHHFVQRLVWDRGVLWEEMYRRVAETADLAAHGSLVRGAHEFILVNVASFMHYTLVLSPEGPSLLRMVENVHKLAPYVLVRQTLKVGNVATMISGMVRLMLAKVSVTSVTNWLGISKGEDEGMNLLQRIIDQVLAWDKRELKKRLEKVEKDKEVPSREVRRAIDEWIEKSRQEHDETRRQSKEQGMSIVQTILTLSSTDTDIPEAQHGLALEYLSLQLDIRDRTEIVRVLCKSTPDHLTQGIRDGVAAYEPMIRQVHEAVDLSGTLWDFEQFVNDMIKVSKPSKKDKAPSVEDYIRLLHNHQASTHRFLHQVAKNGPEVTKWFKDYCVAASANFKAADGDEKRVIKDGLQTCFDELPPNDKEKVVQELDAHSKYLDDLHASSASRIKDVIADKKSTTHGPGSYLARWQELLDSTEVTPHTPKGQIRRGKNRSVKTEGRKDVTGELLESGIDMKKADEVVDGTTPDPPSINNTIAIMLPKFEQILLDRTSQKGLEV